MTQLQSKYSIDGFRFDTVAEIESSFWADFSKAAGVYAVGEVDTGDVACLGPYSQVDSCDFCFNFSYFLCHGEGGGKCGRSLNCEYTVGGGDVMSLWLCLCSLAEKFCFICLIG